MGKPIDANEFIDFLHNQGILEYRQKQNEISFPCPFRGCDDDHRNREEFHCSFNLKKGVYNCFKCEAKGTFVALQKHFGNYEKPNYLQGIKNKSSRKKSNNREQSFDRQVRKKHEETYEQARSYFNARGINDDSIAKNLLGIMEKAGREYYSIPVFNRNGEVAYVKLRRTLEDEQAEIVGEAMGAKKSIPKYQVYPAGSELLLVGEYELSMTTSTDVLICEGELDRIMAIQEGVEMPVVTGGGAQTFKDEWIDSLENMRNIYICFDNDETGEKAAANLAKRISEKIPSASVFMITLPFEGGSHGDISDYFLKKKGNVDDLFTKYTKFYCGTKPIDVSKLKEMTVEDIAKVLDTTIKYDFTNKVITLLAMLLAYTESDQLNIMYNADSSSGKTYICQEASKYFPKQDVYVYGKVTPTAFYYSKRFLEQDPETGQTAINLARRILIFTEQPDTQLQENLRALLSHDDKRIPFAITNKKGSRNVAEEGYLIGFPSTFFCSANLRIDEQEQTRCLILSPESSNEKVMAGIEVSIAKNSNREKYNALVENDEGRRLLKDRIVYIKSLNVQDINIDDSDYLRKRFLENLKNPPRRAQRDIAHFTSLVKAMALINAPFRMKDGKIEANKKDVDEAMKLWKPLCESIKYGVSPQTLNFYKSIVLPAYYDKKDCSLREEGVTYNDIRREYRKQTESEPNMENIRKRYIPPLETAELIRCEKCKSDGRRKNIIPLVFFDGSGREENEKGEGSEGTENVV